MNARRSSSGMNVRRFNLQPTVGLQTISVEIVFLLTIFRDVVISIQECGSVTTLFFDLITLRSNANKRLLQCTTPFAKIISNRHYYSLSV